MNNPLLLSIAHALPRFDLIEPEHVAPALDVLLAEADSALERVVGPDVPLDYDAISAVLDVAVERLGTAWGQVSFLQSVADTPALRAAQTRNLPRVTDFYTRLGADTRLYAKYRALAASPQAAALSTTRKKVLADAMRDFVLGGADLQGAARERFAAIQERCSALSQSFGEHVLDATDAFTLNVTEVQLSGVPADVKAAARDAAGAAGLHGYQLSLHAPCYRPVLQFADDRALREQLFRAYNTRASELGPTARDNTAVIEELVALRQEEAALLGLPSYAHVSLVPKMAQSPAEVLAFVRDLARRARPHAERELAEMRDFAATELDIAELQAWDRAYVGEKLLQKRYAFSSTEVKQYFTEPRVLQGLFELVQTLFGVSVIEEPAAVWHPSVRFFRLWRDGAGETSETDETDESGEARDAGGQARAVAAFYLDLQARPGKGQGAWMSSARERWLRPDGSQQLPLAQLVCNFAPPVNGKPALLTHDDVVTLFHEFGHGLQQMLTQVNDLAVAGISGVEWDAVELPSQFMENFCWDGGVLQGMTAHVDTGQPLPGELFERMLAARNFNNGLAMVRQCEYAVFDMRLHAEVGAVGSGIGPGTGSGAVMALANEVSAEVAPETPPAFVRYPHGFDHLFAGGYAAGFYGYAWAEVLSADAFSAFEEAGVFDANTGQRYRQNILETGGSRSAMDNFKAFRGREPKLDALLRYQGLT